MMFISHLLFSLLFILGNALPSDISFFKENGANQVLTKPVNVDSLMKIIKEKKTSLQYEK